MLQIKQFEILFSSCKISFNSLKGGKIFFISFIFIKKNTRNFERMLTFRTFVKIIETINFITLVSKIFMWILTLKSLRKQRQKMVLSFHKSSLWRLQFVLCRIWWRRFDFCNPHTKIGKSRECHRLLKVDHEILNDGNHTHTQKKKFKIAKYFCELLPNLRILK